MIILGGKINAKNEISFTKFEKNINPKTKDELKGHVFFDFELSQNQRRKIDEFDDLKVYFSNKKNSVAIDEIKFGIINEDDLHVDQLTSTNVWISMIDKNLTRMTNKKLNLAYFESQSHCFLMNLNQKFFFETTEFQEYEQKHFPHMHNEDINLALEEITRKKNERGVTNYY